MPDGGFALSGIGLLRDRVFFQLRHKLTHPVHTRFPLRQILHKLQAGRTVEAEVLRLLLQ